jgi:hypothetical protein
MLCGKGNMSGDHGWVHSHPFEARAQGLIISKYEARLPFEVPVFAAGRWVLLDCAGGTRGVEDPTV